MDTSYEEGRVAYLQHKPLTANPHHPASERFEQWSFGWRAELDADLEAQPLDLED